MPTAIELYNAFATDLENIQDEYTVNFVNPYTRAYISARQSLQGTLQAQAKADKEAFEMALTIFTMLGGGMVTPVFAAAAVKAFAKEAALNTICKYNMERAFKVAGLIEANPLASYILGAAWDKADGAVRGKLKEMFEPKATTFPSLEKFVKEPLTIQTYLVDFVVEAKIKLHKTLAMYRDDATLTDQQKLEKLAELKSSPFCKPPAKLSDEAGLANDIELTWYMMHVMDFDTEVVTNKTRLNLITLIDEKEVIRRPVTDNPSSPSYPPNYSRCLRERQSDFVQVEHCQYGEVIYKQDLGGKIKARVDKVYKTRTGKNFFQESWVNRDTLIRAETMLRQLGDSNIGKLARQTKVNG